MAGQPRPEKDEGWCVVSQLHFLGTLPTPQFCCFRIRTRSEKGFSGSYYYHHEVGVTVYALWSMNLHYVTSHRDSEF